MMTGQNLEAKTLAGNRKPIDPNSVCVVGSGPVGLAFCLRLANAGQAVTLIDSGSFSAHDKGRAFNEGTVVSAALAQDRTDPTLLEKGTLYQYYNSDYLSWSRYLGSGGGANRWGVQWRPSTESRVRLVPGKLSDFAARPDLDIPAWVAPASEIHNRYQDALSFFGLGNQNFDTKTYQTALQPIPLPPSLLPTKLFHFARADVIKRRRMNDVIDHPGVNVCSGLHLVRIETDKQERVKALITCDQRGHEVRIKAKHYVLALGGIENSRQLLLAKQEGALADPHDVFGRWFCDHPHTRLGFLTGQDPDAMIQMAAWYDFQKVNDTPVLHGHELAPTAAKNLGLLRFSIDLVGRPAGYCSRGGVAIAQALEACQRRDIKALISSFPRLLQSPVRTLQLVHNAGRNPVHGTHLGGWSDLFAQLHRVDTLAVEAMFEQRPSPDNRVRLGTKCDPLGRQLPVLQWSWSQKETESINRAAELMASAFNKTGVGSFTTMGELGQREIPRAGSGFHHMGGTRQSVEPEAGVVNADNRVHGVENLTIIGSSVFPNTVGYANPTLTAVADALRVADRLFQSSYRLSSVPPLTTENRQTMSSVPINTYVSSLRRS